VNCPECGQPMLPAGQTRPNADWYRHARGCSRDDVGKPPPESAHWPLWKHMSETHGITLLESECVDIIEAVRKTCSVPQYDIELKLAAELVAQWRSVAKQLHAAIGLSRRERRRLAAENAFRKMETTSQMEGSK